MTHRGVRPLDRRPLATAFFSIARFAAALCLSSPASAEAPPARPARTAAHEAVEAGIRREVAAESQEALSAFERGTGLRDEGNVDGAAAAFEEAVGLAPKSPHPVRRLCTTRSLQGRHDEAIARCREAVALSDVPMNRDASRLQEVLADRWAAFTYGASAFEGGLRHVIAASVAFDARANAVLNEVVKQKSSLSNLYTYEPETPPDPAELEREVEEALNREASPYDSHPSPADRFTLVHRLAGTPTPEDDGTLALSLLSDTDAVQREMTREVCGRVAEQTGVFIPSDDAPKKRRRKKPAAEEAEAAEETQPPDDAAP